MIGHKQLLLKAKLINSPTFFMGLAILSLVYSLYFISIGLIGWALVTIINPKIERGVVKRHYRILLLALIFFVSLIWGIGGDDPSFWMGRIRLHVPFLVLPAVFLMAQPISFKQYVWYHYIFLGSLVTVIIGTVIYYVFNFEVVQLGLREGRAIPVPVNHIRLSLMLVYGIFMCWWIRERVEGFRTLGLVIGILLILGLHFLAVRNGLFVFYVLVFLELFRRVRFYALILFLVPVFFVGVFPSFRAKVGYTMYEIKKIWEGSGDGYSTGDRMDSVMDGWKLFTSKPWFGVGTANLRLEMKKLNEGKERLIMPHNQFVNVLSAAGIIGFLIFYFGYLGPLTVPGMMEWQPVRWLYGIITLSMIFESTLDTSDAVGFFLIFLLLSFHYLRYKERR
jgi:O-antigen ligase